MKLTDKPEFFTIIMGLAAIKPGKALTDDGIALFWSAMQDWDITEFRQAANQLARTSEFMPNPYHFEQLRKAAGETAGEAWAKVRGALRAMNRYDPVSLGDRTDRVVRAMGGYVALSETDSVAMVFREKRFAELWDELGEAEEVRLALPSFGDRKQPPAANGPQGMRSIIGRIGS